MAGLAVISVISLSQISPCPLANTPLTNTVCVCGKLLSRVCGVVCVCVNDCPGCVKFYLGIVDYCPGEKTCVLMKLKIPYFLI